MFRRVENGFMKDELMGGVAMFSKIQYIQLITGHGPFNVYLNRFRLRETNISFCVGYLHHILQECPNGRRVERRSGY